MTFLGEPSFYYWCIVGCVFAVFSGYYSMSRGSLFRRWPGLILLNGSYFAILGTLCAIGYLISIGGALAVSVLLFVVFRSGGRAMIRKIGY